MLASLEAEQNRRRIENRIAYYKPYPKQVEFHEAGATHRERLLMAANQSGKTYAGGSEGSYHATGRYPDDWKGFRFDGPTIGWACGETSEVVRDTVQRILVGRIDAHGTGTIPKDDILEIVPARGIADAIDMVKVRHVSGGVSIVGFKSYSSGREKFQGETLDWIWFDEEPPPDIYTEGLTRTNVASGPSWMTFTPLKGVSEVVRRFLLEESEDRHITTMTIEDALHYSDEQRRQIIASYPAHEVEARTKGIPVLGSGRIFPIPDEQVATDLSTFPSHWPRLGGMDFGYDHPFAAIEMVWDRDSDTVYVTKAYRNRQGTPILHAAALRSWGESLPWSWPRDGRRETLEGAGIALARQYTDQKLNMLHEHAQFEDGSVSVEAGLMDMLDRMQTGRFKVCRHLNEWFEEFRLYHREDGKVVKEHDDLMAATRYALMMLRYARTVSAYKNFRRTIEYSNLGVA